MISRNVQNLKISNTLLSEWFHNLIDVPKDIRIRAVQYKPYSDTIDFLLESEEFEELPEGAIPMNISIYGREHDDEITMVIGNWRITKFQNPIGHRNYFRAWYKGIEIDNVMGFEWQTGTGKIPTVKIETREMKG